MDHKRAMETTKYVDLPYATKQETKFMNLLNEYLAKYYAEHGNKNLYIELEWWSIFNVHEIVVISSRFWFIKRLVYNDKIDYQKDWHNSNDTWYVYVKADTKKTDLEIKSDTLLMVLAIENEPIKFLCSILK